jgi:hypothetical protein
LSTRHIEWLIGEPVPDPELMVYEVLPYAPAQANRIIEHLCRLAGLEVGRGGHDPERAERVRRAFGFRDKSARIALRWALRDLGLAGRAVCRWLHQLHDNPVMLRRVIDRALEARLLQRDAGRTDRVDRVVLVQGVGSAYQLLTGRPLGRSLTAEQRPTGPGVRLVRLCLTPLDPLATVDAIAWAIRRVQTQS